MAREIVAWRLLQRPRTLPLNRWALFAQWAGTVALVIHVMSLCPNDRDQKQPLFNLRAVITRPCPTTPSRWSHPWHSMESSTS